MCDNLYPNLRGIRSHMNIIHITWTIAQANSLPLDINTYVDHYACLLTKLDFRWFCFPLHLTMTKNLKTNFDPLPHLLLLFQRTCLHFLLFLFFSFLQILFFSFLSYYRFVCLRTRGRRIALWYLMRTYPNFDKVPYLIHLYTSVYIFVTQVFILLQFNPFHS